MAEQFTRFDAAEFLKTPEEMAAWGARVCTRR